MTAIAVIAKAPVPGRSKTRLTPPCTPEQAATLATAALADTLAAVAATPGGARRVVVLDGAPGSWLRPRLRGHRAARRRAGRAAGRRVRRHRRAGARRRDGHAAAHAADAVARAGAGSPAADAVLGAACDGGYWSIGLRAADDAVFAGVPMSDPATCAVQRARLHALGLTTHELPVLRDVDDIADARAVALLAPRTRFARTLAALRLARGRRGMTPTAADVYGLALAHDAPPKLRARRPDGTAMALALHRWLGPLTAADEAVLDRARGAGARRRLRPRPPRPRARAPRPPRARRRHRPRGRARRAAARRARHRGLGLRPHPRRRHLGQRAAARRQHRHRRRARRAARAAARAPASRRRGARRARAARRGRHERAHPPRARRPAQPVVRLGLRRRRRDRRRRREAAGFAVAERWQDERRWFARLVAAR